MIRKWRYFFPVKFEIAMMLILLETVNHDVSK